VTRFESRQADWLPVDEARERILQRAAALPAVRVQAAAALGRALAEPLTARATLPPWDNSAMDGYAVRADDVRNAGPHQPVRLRVAGAVRAGELPSTPVTAGEAIRIMTGAPVPPGADTVVRVEDTDAEATPGTVVVRDGRDAGRHVRSRGEDMREGDLVLEAGTTLGPGHIGVIGALGASEVAVAGRPRVALLASGDELVPPERFDAVAQGRAIPETNSRTLAAAVEEMSGHATLLGIAGDTEESVDLHVRRALESDAHVLITTAGASMGESDLFKRVLDGQGFELDFWRVRMRPGSPFSFGYLPRASGPPLTVFGLPGNPASAFVTFHVLVRPYLLSLAGHRCVHAAVVHARAGGTLRSAPGLTQFLRVRLTERRSGTVATPTGPQGSGLVRSMGEADGLAVMPEGVEAIEEGAPVQVLLLRPGAGWCEQAGYVSAIP